MGKSSYHPVEHTHLKCYACSAVKPVDAFATGGPGSRSFRQGYCRECQGQYLRHYRGIAAGRPKARRTAWTSEEMDTLTRLYGSMPTSQLQAEYLARHTLRAVQEQARRLGLDFWERWWITHSAYLDVRGYVREQEVAA